MVVHASARADPSVARPDWHQRRSFGTEVEEFCNNVAAEWMLPVQTLDQIQIDRNRNLFEQQRLIDEFAPAAEPEPHHGRLQAPTCGSPRLADVRSPTSVFHDRWRQQRDRQRAKARESESGVDYYVVRRHRVGQALLGFAHRMMDSGVLSTTKVARILGVKPAHVGRMLRPPTAR